MNELAGDWYLPSDSALSEEIFPELHESEDEKVRKEIMQLIQGMHDADPRKERWLAWLEKQGEKPHGKSAREAIKEEKVDNANKVEPKFKVGDWVVSPNGVYWHIDKISNNRYEVTSNTGESSNWPLDTNIYHKFTIQDAKDGDVLIDKSDSREGLFIFKETKPSDIKTDVLNNPLTVLGYCGIGGAGFTKGSGWGDTANCTYYPATKKQHDTLFKAMADAGYTFDFEKKELKKIEQKQEENKRNLGGISSNWSEEDASRLEEVICMVEANGRWVRSDDAVKSVLDWLKSLQQRIGE